jgi:hypothetical protein
MKFEELVEAMGALEDALHEWMYQQRGERIAVYAAAYELRSLVAERCDPNEVDRAFEAAEIEPWCFQERAEELFRRGDKLDAILIAEAAEALRPEFAGIDSARYRGDMDPRPALKELKAIAADRGRTAWARVKAIRAIAELEGVEACIEPAVAMLRAAAAKHQWDDAYEAAEALTHVLFPVTSHGKKSAMLRSELMTGEEDDDLLSLERKH